MARTERRERILGVALALLLAALGYYLYLHLQDQKQLQAMRSSLTKLRQDCQSWQLKVPCGPGDDKRKIYQVKGLGRFCIEQKSGDLIKGELRSGRPWEPKIQAAMKKHVKAGDVVLDVGAHIGSHTLFLSRLVGPKGRVHAFEPQQKIYQELLTNLKLSKRTNVRAHFTALGASYGLLSMAPPVAGNEGATALGEGGNRVELRALDSFALPKVSLIKIDVEGAEYGVLRGAKKLLTRHKPILFVELWSDAKHRKNYEKVVAFLKTLGYRRFTPIGQDVFVIAP